MFVNRVLIVIFLFLTTYFFTVLLHAIFFVV